MICYGSFGRVEMKWRNFRTRARNVRLDHGMLNFRSVRVVSSLRLERSKDINVLIEHHVQAQWTPRRSRRGVLYSVGTNRLELGGFNTVLHRKDQV